MSSLVLLLALVMQPAYARTVDPCEALMLSRDSVGEELPDALEERVAYASLLQHRYRVPEGKVEWGHSFPVVIRGGGERSYFPKADLEHVETDPGEYDAVIVGAGPAGLTAGVYLTENGKRVLIVERDKQVGGLGQGGIQKRVRYGRGGAYFADINGIDYKIYRHLGLGHYKRDLPIPEPIDSYVWNGKLYEGLWEPETLKQLPASFEVFKYYLHKAGKEGLITSQPMEENKATFELDKLSMAQWVRTFPEELAKLAPRDAEARRIYQRFLDDPNMKGPDPMKDVIGLLDLYGRSAMGDHADRISAAGYANFYLSELDTRYAGDFGTGTISEQIHKRLLKRKSLVTIKTEASAAKVVNTADGVDVYYVKDGKTYKAHARSAVMGTSMNVSAGIIDNFEKQAPEQFKTIQSLSFRHYLVINVHLKGQAWRKSYDLWVRNDADYSQAEFTDVVDGRWVDFGGGEHSRTDDHGILTIYQPLPEAATEGPLTDSKVTEIAERAVQKLRETIEPLLARDGEARTLKPMLVEVNRWLYSIHLVEPGHFAKSFELRKPLGNVHFADNNIGVPAVEEGIYRGYRAAREILMEQGAGKHKKLKIVPERKSDELLKVQQQVAH